MHLIATSLSHDVRFHAECQLMRAVSGRYLQWFQSPLTKQRTWRSMNVPPLRASQPLGNLGHHGSNELPNKTTTRKACKEASFRFVVDSDFILLGLGIKRYAMQAWKIRARSAVAILFVRSAVSKNITQSA